MLEDKKQQAPIAEDKESTKSVTVDTKTPANDWTTNCLLEAYDDSTSEILFYIKSESDGKMSALGQMAEVVISEQGPVLCRTSVKPDHIPRVIGLVANEYWLLMKVKHECVLQEFATQCLKGETTALKKLQESKLLGFAVCDPRQIVPREKRLAIANGKSVLFLDLICAETGYGVNLLRRIERRAINDGMYAVELRAVKEVLHFYFRQGYKFGKWNYPKAVSYSKRSVVKTKGVFMFKPLRDALGAPIPVTPATPLLPLKSTPVSERELLPSDWLPKDVRAAIESLNKDLLDSLDAKTAKNVIEMVDTPKLSSKGTSSVPPSLQLSDSKRATESGGVPVYISHEWIKFKEKKRRLQEQNDGPPGKRTKRLEIVDNVYRWVLS